MIFIVLAMATKQMMQSKFRSVSFARPGLLNIQMKVHEIYDFLFRRRCHSKYMSLFPIYRHITQTQKLTRNLAVMFFKKIKTPSCNFSRHSSNEPSHHISFISDQNICADKIWVRLDHGWEV